MGNGMDGSYLEMVQELVVGIEDMKESIASFLVGCIDDLLEGAIQVLPEASP